MLEEQALREFVSEEIRVRKHTYIYYIYLFIY